MLSRTARKRVDCYRAAMWGTTNVSAPKVEEAKPRRNPWLVTLAWLGAAVFLLGVLFICGAGTTCSALGCHFSGDELSAGMLLGIVLLSTALVIWALAMTAAAIGWQSQKRD